MSSSRTPDIEMGPVFTDKAAPNAFSRKKSMLFGRTPAESPGAEAKKLPSSYKKFVFGLDTVAAMLLSAVEKGTEADEVVAKEMLDRLRNAGPDLRRSVGFIIQDDSGNGLLQIAALKNYVGMTKLLLENDFDINGVDSNHGTPLQAACYMGRQQVIEVLFSWGEERISKLSSGNSQGISDGDAVHLKALEKVKVNSIGGYYGTALQCACYKGDLALIRRLLDRGADVNIRGGKYGSCLQAAARTGLPKVVKLILGAKPPPDMKFQGGVYGSALQAACKGPYTKATKFLRHLSRGKVLKQQTDVERAREDGNYFEVVKILLKNGANVNMRGGLLHCPINAAASSGSLDILRLLVDYNKSTEEELKKEAYGRALISAISQKSEDHDEVRLNLARLLVEEGAALDFETGSSLYNRPLTAAAAMNSVSVMKYILEEAEKRQPGQKVALMNKETGVYGTALRAALAVRKKDTAEFLISQGADLQSGDKLFGNVLHLAVFSNLPSTVQMLLDHGVPVNATDDWGQAALHIAAYRGYLESTTVLLSAKDIDPMKRDAWGDSPLDIVEAVLERGNHPGPSLEAVRMVKQKLLKVSVAEEKQLLGRCFKGPPVNMQARHPQLGKARPVFSSPNWNPGLGFQATITDFIEYEGNEYVVPTQVSVDNLMYRTDYVLENLKNASGLEGGERMLRWIHLPANNMTWAEMLLQILWSKTHADTSCKSFWGTDPYYVSPDLAPHARFVTPQCDRLIYDTEQDVIQDSEKSDQKAKNTLFLAMPYIHWESYRAQFAVSKLLNEIHEVSLKTRVRRSGGTWKQLQDPINPRNGKGATDLNNSSNLTEDATPDIFFEDKDADDQLLINYIFKRWPIHLRRTLDQYYYSYLADTGQRDRDQVVTRTRNNRQEEIELDAETLYRYLKKRNRASEDASNVDEPGFVHLKRLTREEARDPNDEKKKVEKYFDPNSPLIVIDQLWLWVLDKDLIVTNFPQRRSVKDGGDIDSEGRTDVFKTIIGYLHSTKRHPIRSAYDLSELIVSQAVAILHRADLTPDLDFLKIFGSQADQAIDQVMTKLTKFAERFREFEKWTSEKNQNSEQYIQKFEKIFSVTEETELLREIQDIKDELGMLTAVFADQERVLKDVNIAIERDRAATEETKASSFNFEQQSQKHGRHIKRMRNQADQAYSNLKDLLDLKQSQANVLEARHSRNQALTSQEQSKTILVFTIVTIVFLPLTFMTTIFTLPMTEFPWVDPKDLNNGNPNGQLKGSYVFSIVVSLTVVMAVPLVLIAFKIKRIETFWYGATKSDAKAKAQSPKKLSANS